MKSLDGSDFYIFWFSMLLLVVFTLVSFVYTATFPQTHSSGKLTALDSGESHTCAVFDDGKIKCWGTNYDGKLGVGHKDIVGIGPYEMGSNLSVVDLGKGFSANKICAGVDWFCATLSNGSVKCWGDNVYRVLGNGLSGDIGWHPGQMGENLPYTDLGPNRTAVRVSCGTNRQNLAVLDNGRFRFWGANSYGESVFNLEANKTVVDACTGERHSCFLLNDTTVRCVGRVDQHVVDLGANFVPVSLFCGEYFSCAVSGIGEAKCWGDNSAGQCGQGHTTRIAESTRLLGDNLTVIDVGTGMTIRSMCLGRRTACAILSNMSMKCWGGGNDVGSHARGDTGYNLQMGDDLLISDLGTGRTAVLCDTSGSITCVVLDDATLKCFGDNSNGALGDGSRVNAGGSASSVGDNWPIVDVGNHGVIAVAVDHAKRVCAVLNTGKIVCWGKVGSQGALGIGIMSEIGNKISEMGSALPFVHMGSDALVKSVHCGNTHTCVLLENLRVKCWGSNVHGQLGYEDTFSRGRSRKHMGDALPTVNLGDGQLAVSLCVGNFHSCAVLKDGSVKCWGLNLSGQLGLGHTFSIGAKQEEMGENLNRTEIGTNIRARSVYCGGSFTCVVLNDTNSKCWGSNDRGVLGQGSSVVMLGDNSSHMGDNLPTIDLGVPVLEMSCAQAHVCAIVLHSNTRKLKCWGVNRLIGYGDNVSRGTSVSHMGVNLPFVQLGSNRTIVSLRTRNAHTCVLMSNGDMFCFGDSARGELGGIYGSIGRTPESMGDALRPVSLGTSKQARSITTGNRFTCAILKIFGEMKCWGGENAFVLGNGQSAYGDVSWEMGDRLPLTDLGQSLSLITARFSSENAYTFQIDFTIKTGCLEYKWTECDVEKIFDNSTTQKLGEVPVKCFWDSAECSFLSVQMGRNAKLTAGDLIMFRRTSLIVIEDSFAVNITLQPVEIELPSTLAPVIVRISVDQEISVCENLTMTMIETQGLGGREPQNISWIVEAADLSFSETYSTDSVIITTDFMNPGTTYRISLNVTNWQGMIGYNTVNVTKGTIPSLKVSLIGPDVWKNSLGKVSFSSFISLPAHRCNNSLDERFQPGTWKIAYNWTSNNIMLQNVLNTAHSSSVKFSPVALPLLQKYQVDLTIDITSTLTNNSLFHINRFKSFRMDPSSLLIVFKRGNEMSAYRVQNVKIDSSASIDYDNFANRTYEWSITCWNIADFGCQNELNLNEWVKYALPSVSTAELIIPKGTFQQSLVLNVTLLMTASNSGFSKSASSSILLSVLDIFAPQVTAQALKYAAVQKYPGVSTPITIYNWNTNIRLSSSYEFGENKPNRVSADWECAILGDSQVLLLNSTVRLSEDVSSDNLVLNSSASAFINEIIWKCSRIVTYEFKDFNSSANASVLFVVNSAPHLGRLVTSAYKGNALEDYITLSAVFWEDDHTPLMFSFAVLRWDANFSALDYFSPDREIISSKSFKSTARTLLSAGEWRCLLYVEDNLGAVAVTSLHEPILIQTPPLNITTMVKCDPGNILSQRLGEVRGLEDSDQILFLIQQISRALLSEGNYSLELISSLMDCDATDMNATELVTLIMDSFFQEILVLISRTNDISRIEQLISTIFSVTNENSEIDISLSLQILEKILNLFVEIIQSDEEEFVQQSRAYWFDMLFQIVASLVNSLNDKECEKAKQIFTTIDRVLGFSLENTLVNENTTHFNSSDTLASVKKIGSDRDSSVETQGLVFTFPGQQLPNNTSGLNAYVIKIAPELYRCMYKISRYSESNNTFTLNCGSPESSIYGYTYDISVNGPDGEMKISELDDSVRIQYDHIPNSLATELKCEWFDKVTLSWKTDGCEKSVERVNEDFSKVLCLCSHLTEFALIYTQKIDPSCEETGHPLNLIEGAHNIIAFVVYVLISLLSILLILNMKQDLGMVNQKLRNYVYWLVLVYSIISCVRYMLFTLSKMRSLPIVFQALLAVLNVTILYCIQSIVFLSWYKLVDTSISQSKRPMVEKLKKPFILMNVGMLVVDVVFFVSLAQVKDQKLLKLIFTVGSVVFSTVCAVMSIWFIYIATSLFNMMLELFPLKKSSRKKTETSVKMAVAFRILRSGKVLSGILLVFAILNTVPLLVEDTVLTGESVLLFIMHILNFVLNISAILVVINLYKPKRFIILEVFTRRLKGEVIVQKKTTKATRNSSRKSGK